MKHVYIKTENEFENENCCLMRGMFLVSEMIDCCARFFPDPQVSHKSLGEGVG